MIPPVRRVFWLLIASLVIFAIGLVIFAWNIGHQAPDPDKKADGMIVLTGSADRIPDAIDLFAKGYAARMLITGVNTGITRAEIGRLNPKHKALIDCCVDLGYEAVNTYGNAREARRWAEQNGIKQSLIVVTSDYHMPRALAELHNVLPSLDLIPYPVVNVRMREGKWWQSPQGLRLVTTEYVKYILVSGRIFFRNAWSSLQAIIN
jgi:uncharacterized SAM-binding protein YcdF (DUF218 family)